MTGRIALAVSLIVVAIVLARVLDRRRSAPPTQPAGWRVPAQLDRADFTAPEKPWLIAVFTSSTCDTCAGVMAKAEVLATADVAFDDVPWQDRRALHDRYGIEVVPLTLVADADGVVRASFVGAVTATDLWAAVAEARSPGASPEPGLGR